MITVSFKCKDHGHALLLQTLYDLLTVEDIESSISAIDYTGWLLDEIGARLEEIDEFDTGIEEHRLSGLALEVCELYRMKK
jgi:hypothetical protein